MSDFQRALALRESAAFDLQTAAQLLTDASARYTAAVADLIAEIPNITAPHGQRAHDHAKSQFTDPPHDDREANRRKLAAAGARQGAAGAVEFKVSQALSNGFQLGTAEATLGLELSPEAAEFLSHAVRVALTRPQFSKPINRFYSLVQQQNQKIYEIAK